MLKRSVGESLVGDVVDAEKFDVDDEEEEEEEEEVDGATGGQGNADVKVSEEEEDEEELVALSKLNSFSSSLKV